MRSGSSWYCVVTGKTLSWEDVTGRSKPSARARLQRKAQREKTDELHRSAEAREARFATLMSIGTAAFIEALRDLGQDHDCIDASTLAQLCDVSATQALLLMRKHGLLILTSVPFVPATPQQAVMRCSKCKRPWRTLRSGEISTICRYAGCSGDPVTP